MRKIILSAFFLFLLVIGLTTDVKAKTPEQNGAALDNYRQIGEVSSPVHVFDVKDSDAYWLTCAGIGVGCTANVQGAQTYFQNSALGQVGSGIAYLIQNQPAQTSQFIAYYGQKMGIVKEAYAQSTGIGFSGLRPLMNLWVAFRNVAYGFLIIVMVLVGFMILFRAKIDPRTVISIQSAIPRIIVTLFLITFSYAIVGLLIDIMYLSIFFALAILSPVTSSQANLTEIITRYTGGNLWTLFGAVWSGGMQSVNDISTFLGGNVANIGTTVGLFFGGLLLGAGSPWGIFVYPAIAAIGGVAANAAGNNPLVWLLVALALIFTFIRIFVMLLNAYIGVILSLLFGPLQIMLGAIPNSNAFSSWLRNLIANLAVFPVTVIMFIMGTILSTYAAQGGLWTPPGLSGQNISGAVSGIIGLGIVFVIPTIAHALKEMLKSKPIIPTGTGAVMSPVTSVYGTAMGGISQIYYLKSMFGGKPKQ